MLTHDTLHGGSYLHRDKSEVLLHSCCRRGTAFQVLDLNRHRTMRRHEERSMRAAMRRALLVLPGRVSLLRHRRHAGSGREQLGGDVLAGTVELVLGGGKLKH